MTSIFFSLKCKVSFCMSFFLCICQCLLISIHWSRANSTFFLTVMNKLLKEKMYTILTSALFPHIFIYLSISYTHQSLSQSTSLTIKSFIIATYLTWEREYYSSLSKERAAWIEKVIFYRGLLKSANTEGFEPLNYFSLYHLFHAVL